VAYVRTVRTASGATAVQIVHSTRRGSRDIEHLGSAHDEADWRRSTPLRGSGWPKISLARDVAREHRELVEAVLARDAELAVQRLAAHYRLRAQLCNLPHVR
jgi:DNA-binding GntR family transcriptional regulator